MDGAARVRRFNRTVTRHIGVLESDFLGRRRPLGASRVLWEIGDAGIEIRALRERLGLDSGYARRLVAGLEAEGLVRVARSEADARVRVLELTRAGREERALLDRLSEERAGALLEPLGPQQREALVDAMATVERLLLASGVTIALEDPASRDARHCLASYYEELATRFEAGFDPVRSISADPQELTPPNGCFLVARLHGRPVGCGAAKLHADFAEIKRMWVDAEVRGLGVGGRLLDELERIAKGHGIGLARLETNRSLVEAQALYRARGYREVAPFNDERYAHHWFEKEL